MFIIRMISSCFRRGVNNIIRKNVRIHENVIIGNNNKVFDRKILGLNIDVEYNNVRLNENPIIEYHTNSNDDHEHFVYIYEKDYNNAYIRYRCENEYMHIEDQHMSEFEKHYAIVYSNNRIKMNNLNIIEKYEYAYNTVHKL